MKVFRLRPYDPDRPDNRTAAQRAAADRNFRIFKLRGLASFRFLLTGKRREAMLRLVDQELKSMGAEMQSARIAREQQELEKEFM